MTILGQHTIAEIRDLYNAYNYQQDQLEKAAAGAASQWMSVDPDGYNTWKHDYDSWNAEYQGARNHTNTVLSSIATTLQDVETDETTYQQLASAFLPFADLDRRMRAGPVGSNAPKYDNNPQPMAPDADLGAYKATDAGTRAMPDIVKSAIANLAPGLVPQTSDQKNYKALSTTQKILITAGAIVGLGLLVKVAK